jgi:hypothetical protein
LRPIVFIQLPQSREKHAFWGDAHGSKTKHKNLRTNFLKESLVFLLTSER